MIGICDGLVYVVLQFVLVDMLRGHFRMAETLACVEHLPEQLRFTEFFLVHFIAFGLEPS